MFFCFHICPIFHYKKFYDYLMYYIYIHIIKNHIIQGINFSYLFQEEFYLYQFICNFNIFLLHYIKHYYCSSISNQLSFILIFFQLILSKYIFTLIFLLFILLVKANIVFHQCIIFI